MFHRIIVGWDGSGGSETALEWALRRAHNTPLKVIHVVSGHLTGTDYLSAAPASSIERVTLMDVADRIRQRHPEIALETATVHGRVQHELASFAEPGSLLVIGSSARRTSRLSTGWSVGSRLAAAHLSGTVAVIPIDALAGDSSGIVVAVDANTSPDVLRVAIDEARENGEELQVIHAWCPPPGWEEDLAPDYDDAASLVAMHEKVVTRAAEIVQQFPEVRVIESVIEGAAADAIVEAARGAREIVIGNHNYRGLGRFFIGSVCHAVLLELPAPTLVVHS